MAHPSRDSLIEQLQSVPYFAGLHAATLHTLADLATWHEYAPGAVVFLEGELNTGLYSVYTGWVKVVMFSLDGREQVLRYFGPGEVFNEIGIFLARPNPATALALEQSGLWQLHRSASQPLLAAHPDLLLQVMANMAERIAYLAGMVADLSLHTVEVRLARLLLDAAPDDALVRQSWLTQAELAARLGTVPDVLSRALRDLADAGLIQFDRRQISILDRPGLAQRARLVE
ncbi:MAG: Crp/Fnr family transcriptional regulator [Caldilineaceae bacterium]|jgi:CRP/FNR family transcriptional regulator|nr:Crp/Fnr family transcriptional regulator [Caldilineaceae bacterium]